MGASDCIPDLGAPVLRVRPGNAYCTDQFAVFLEFDSPGPARISVVVFLQYQGDKVNAILDALVGIPGRKLGDLGVRSVLEHVLRVVQS